MQLGTLILPVFPMSIWCHVLSVQVLCVHVMYLTGPFSCRPIIITLFQRYHSNSHSHPSMTAVIPWCQKACPRQIMTWMYFTACKFFKSWSCTKGDSDSHTKEWLISVTPLVLFLLFLFSLHDCRGHTCCPHVMLLFLVPVPGTFLLLSSFDILLAIVPCNEITPHCTPHGGPSPFLLVATPIPIPQLVYKLQ